MKKTGIFKIVFIVLLFAGLLILFYPALRNIVFVYQQNKVIDEYNEQVQSMDKQSLDDMKTKAHEYNDRLSGETPINASENNSETVSGNLSYSQLLNMSDELMGYIVIPKISLNQPIYHSTEEDVLERGIGHIKTSSLPVGGKSTHCVLTGHTGVPGMMLFTDLHKMEMGDKFYIKTLDEVLAYQIDQIKTVLPNDTSDLKIKKDEDYVTLVTCTPYGLNTHRLLVRGTRVEYNGEIDDNKPQNDGGNSKSSGDENKNGISTSKFSFEFVLYYIIIPALIILFAAALVIIFRKRRKRKSGKYLKESKKKSDDA